MHTVFYEMLCTLYVLRFPLNPSKSIVITRDSVIYMRILLNSATCFRNNVNSVTNDSVVTRFDCKKKLETRLQRVVKLVESKEPRCLARTFNGIVRVFPWQLQGRSWVCGSARGF